MSDETVVEAEGVTVSKFFNAEDFPVPAVAFDVSSSRDTEVTLTITDEIPDEFGIDQIGFHPEYGSEHWTATGDGVVRFERDIEADEAFTTVYGVRMTDGQDETPFLSTPTVDVDGEHIDDVVPPESTDVVRELAGGERDTVPGLEDDGEQAGDADELEAEVRAGAGASTGLDSTVTDDAEILGDEAGLTDSGADGGDIEADADDGLDTDLGSDDGDSGQPSGTAQADPLGAEEDGDTEPSSAGRPFDGDDGPDGGTALTAESGLSDDDRDTDGSQGADFGAANDHDDTGATDADATAAGTVALDEVDVASALADAIRNDEVDDDDLETIQDAMGGVSQSTTAEIDHLQSRVSELEAYTDALEAFIDENGPAQDLLTDLEDDVASLEDDLAAVSDDVAGVEDAVEAANEDRDDLWTRIDDVEAEFDAVDDLETSLDHLRGDVEALDERLSDAEDDVLAVDAVEADVEALEDDLAEVSAHVDEIDDWRDQLSDVFGT